MKLTDRGACEAVEDDLLCATGADGGLLGTAVAENS